MKSEDNSNRDGKNDQEIAEDRVISHRIPGGVRHESSGEERLNPYALPFTLHRFGARILQAGETNKVLRLLRWHETG
jgi:hypothetical protein